MNVISTKIMESSLQAALASIEIYNKPNFNYREQVFVILIVNAWELLLKAKIIRDAGEALDSVYVILPSGKPKSSRSGNPMTIDMGHAAKRLKLHVAVSENLSKLLEIRDTAVHFYFNESLSYLVFTLGVASLKNYQTLIEDWFGRSLREYNLQILPLAFTYNFKTLSLLEIEKQPEVIANLIKSVSSVQSSIDQTSDFHFVCEVITEIRSAKKYLEDADFVTHVDSTAPEGSKVFIKTQRLIDRYPITYHELVARVRKVVPGVKQHQIDKTIRDHHIKTDAKYFAYNFRSKIQEETYKRTGILPKSLPCIYNEDAVRCVIENVKV